MPAKVGGAKKPLHPAAAAAAGGAKKKKLGLISAEMAQQIQVAKELKELEAAAAAEDGEEEGDAAAEGQNDTEGVDENGEPLRAERPYCKVCRCYVPGAQLELHDQGKKHLLNFAKWGPKVAKEELAAKELRKKEKREAKEAEAAAAAAATAAAVGTKRERTVDENGNVVEGEEEEHKTKRRRLESAAVSAVAAAVVGGAVIVDGMCVVCKCQVHGSGESMRLHLGGKKHKHNVGQAKGALKKKAAADAPTAAEGDAAPTTAVVVVEDEKKDGDVAPEKKQKKTKKEKKEAKAAAAKEAEEADKVVVEAAVVEEEVAPLIFAGLFPVSEELAATAPKKKLFGQNKGSYRMTRGDCPIKPGQPGFLEFSKDYVLPSLATKEDVVENEENEEEDEEEEEDATPVVAAPTGITTAQSTTPIHVVKVKGKGVDGATARRLGVHCGPFLQYLNLCHASGVSGDDVVAIAETCRWMEVLDVRGVRNFEQKHAEQLFGLLGRLKYLDVRETNFGRKMKSASPANIQTPPNLLLDV